MDKSEQINELATSLAKAQAEIKSAAKDSENPHFRSKYADLQSVWEACRGPLTKHGLSVVQMPHSCADETGKMHLFVRTLLLHSSGQWIEESCEIPVTKPDAQGVGACVTYGRRQGLAAIAGVAPGDDDDGETAVGRGATKPLPDVAAPSAPPTPAQAALQPVAPAPAMLNAQADALAAQYGRDVKSVRKECKQMLKSKYPGVEIKDMTVEEATKACDYLCAAFLDAESAAAKEIV